LLEITLRSGFRLVFVHILAVVLVGKIYSNLFHSEESPEETDLSVVEEDFACRVVITCKPPTPDGEMQVEMNYEGEKVLASYLLHSAQQMLED
jgi:hypothetical protein